MFNSSKVSWSQIDGAQNRSGNGSGPSFAGGVATGVLIGAISGSQRQSRGVPANTAISRTAKCIMGVTGGLMCAL